LRNGIEKRQNKMKTRQDKTRQDRTRRDKTRQDKMKARGRQEEVVEREDGD
jgi:hypothetical protein